MNTFVKILIGAFLFFSLELIFNSIVYTIGVLVYKRFLWVSAEFITSPITIIFEISFFVIVLYAVNYVLENTNFIKINENE